VFYLLKTSLRSFAFSLVAQCGLSSFLLIYIVIAKQFKYYADCSVTLCPGRAKIRALCELHSTL